MTDPTTPDRCDRCGGEPVGRDDGNVSVLECADCGNVLGLGDPPTADSSPTDPGEVSTGVVTAVDGDLGQLVGLLRAEAATDAEPVVSADRLLLETAEATLAVTADDGRVEIRELEGESPESGG